MLTTIVKTHIAALTEGVPLWVVVDHIIESHPQYSAGEVRAAVEQVLNPLDTAEGHMRHAEELERYFAERSDHP